MKTRVYFLLIGILIVFSCKNENEYKIDDNSSTILVDNIKECNILPYSSIFDSINFIKLETNENCLIGRIDMLVCYKKKFYILDKNIAKSVFVYDYNGKFLGKIGALGKAPGEYIEPSHLSINHFSDEIMIYDNFSSRIMIYDLHGKFSSSLNVKNRFDEMYAVGKDKIAIYYNFYGNEEMQTLPDHNVHIINSKGKVIYKAFNRRNNKIPNDECSNFFSSSGDDILFSPSYDNKIYTISYFGTSIKYDIDFGVKTLTKDHIYGVLKNKQNKDDIYREIEDSGFAYIKRFCETSNYVVLNVAYQEKIYNVFYSKRTNKVMCSNVYINDMYGLIPGTHSIFRGEGEDEVISYFIPSDIHLDYYKHLMRNSLNQSNFCRNEFLKNLENSDMNNCTNEIKDILLDIDIEPEKNEVQEINSITQNSNPVLILQKIKKF